MHFKLMNNRSSQSVIAKEIEGEEEEEEKRTCFKSNGYKLHDSMALAMDDR